MSAKANPTNNVRLLGYSKPHLDDRAGAEAAIITRPIPGSELEALYRKRLAPQARLQIALTKRWKVFAVCATDEWARQHAARREAP